MATMGGLAQAAMGAPAMEEEAGEGSDDARHAMESLGQELINAVHGKKAADVADVIMAMVEGCQEMGGEAPEAMGE